MRKAARPQAGAVLRATGSSMICFVGDDPGLLRPDERLEALDGLLNHGALAIERKDLFCVGATGARPEAGSAAAGQDHRAKIDRTRHGRLILLEARQVCPVLRVNSSHGGDACHDVKLQRRGGQSKTRVSAAS